MKIKRYRFDCNGRCAPAYTCSEPNDNSGEYVRYDDIAPLLEWLQEKAKEWRERFDKNEMNDFYAGVNSGYEECGEELEAKLKEYL